MDGRRDGANMANKCQELRIGLRAATLIEELYACEEMYDMSRSSTYTVNITVQVYITAQKQHPII